MTRCPSPEGFQEQKGPQRFIREVRESHPAGEVAARIFLPALRWGWGSRGGRVTLSVGGTRCNSMGAAPSCSWSGTDVPGLRQSTWEASNLLGCEYTTSASGPGIPRVGSGQSREATPHGRVCGLLRPWH